MLKLYSWWRSSAAYRVRIALALKNIPYETISVRLVDDEQTKPAYRAINPQGRVPLLVDGDFRLAQSMAILDYLEHTHPRPALLPADARQRARVLAFCHAIVADTHPLQNTGPVKYLGEQFGADEEGKKRWIRHFIEQGLGALERERADAPETPYVFGDAPTWADCVLVPQVANVDRWGASSAGFPRLYALARRVRELPGFIDAAPERQPDAPR